MCFYNSFFIFTVSFYLQFIFIKIYIFEFLYFTALISISQIQLFDDFNNFNEKESHRMLTIRCIIDNQELIYKTLIKISILILNQLSIILDGCRDIHSQR